MNIPKLILLIILTLLLWSMMGHLFFSKHNREGTKDPVDLIMKVLFFYCALSVSVAAMYGFLTHPEP